MGHRLVFTEGGEYALGMQSITLKDASAVLGETGASGLITGGAEPRLTYTSKTGTDNRPSRRATPNARKAPRAR